MTVDHVVDPFPSSCVDRVVVVTEKPVAISFQHIDKPYHFSVLEAPNHGTPLTERLVSASLGSVRPAVLELIPSNQGSTEDGSAHQGQHHATITPV